MNFLSVLYAKAGITVDGVTTLNNTATALTPTTSDNSTNIATTAFVKNQNYYPYPTGTTSQYVRGDGSLATFSQGGGGGGSSVNYYLNGSVSQGTIGGNTYYEMSKTAIIGTNADFSINADGYVAQFVTDAGDPALLNIPGGNWNFEMFFSASSGGGSPSFYVELYKYDGTTLTLIASGSAAPESITGGTATDLYITALAVPSTTLTLTDRLAVRVYVNNSGRTITLHTQNGHLCQVITTFTTGLTALNGLTAQVQNFAVGAGGSDFNISSVVDTHTFNLPTASATKRGALSSIDWSAFDAKVDFGDLSATAPLNYNGSGLFTIAQSSGSTNGYLSSTDWTTFNAKIGGSGTANYVAKFTSGSVVGNSIIYDNGTGVGIGTSSPVYKLDVIGDIYTSGNVRIGGSNVFYFESFNGGWFMSDTTWLRSYSGKSIWIGAGLIGGDGGLTIGYGGTTPPTGGAIIAGYVGIGTNVATAPLDVNGAIRVRGNNQIYFDTTGGTNSNYIGVTNNYWLSLYCGRGNSSGIDLTNGSGILFSDNGSEKMRVASVSGNLLINTTTDAGYKLDVNGSSRVSGIFNVESINQVSRFVSTNTVLYNTYRANSIDVGYIGNGEGLVASGSATDFGIRAENNLILAIGNSTKLYIAYSGAATFASSVNATSFTASNRTILAVGGVYDNATNGNNIGIGFGSGVIISTDGSGAYVAQNIGNATYPWNNITAAGYIKAGADFFAQINGGIFFAGTGAYNSGVLSTNSGNDLILQSGGTGRAYLNSVGDFLVGTTSSIWGTANRGVIQVNGFSTALIGLSINNTNAGYLYHNGADLNIWNTINGVINLATSNTTRLTIAANGTATFTSSVTTKNLQVAGASGGYTTGDNPMIGLGSFPVTNTFGTIEAPYGDKMKFNAYHGFEFKTSNNGASPILMFSIGVTGAATFTSSVTATNFIVPGGTSAQFLKADGSLDSNVYLTATSSTFSYTSSVTLSPTWQNTGVSSTNLGTGAYLVTCNADDFGVGGGQYNCTYTGLMYFFAGGTNGSDANEIVLHHTGHADNGRYIYLRTLSTVSADGKTYLQISGNGTNSGASNYQFTFKKLL
jgi:hypothetical protein